MQRLLLLAGPVAGGEVVEVRGSEHGLYRHLL